MNTSASPTAPAPAPRAPRSFVRRKGRITPGQVRALRESWPRFGIEFSPQPLDLTAVFGRNAPRVLEIGFGNGDALLALAQQQPERDFLGVEVHEPGVGHLLLGAAAAGLTNLKVIRHDAVEVLAQQIPPGAFAEILIFFPDPWPKKRHHKRRLIQPAFVELLAQKLEPGAILRLATDWLEYAEHMVQVLSDCPRLHNLAPAVTFPFVERPTLRPPTRFERRGQRLGHPVRDLAFTRV